MGRSITITAGYGVYIPGSADEDVDFDSADILNSNLKIIKNFLEECEEEDEDSREDFTWWSLSEYIEAMYPLVTLQIANFDEYTYGVVAAVRSTVKKEYRGLLMSVDDINTDLLSNEEAQLREVVELFEVEYDPQVWVSVSYF